MIEIRLGYDNINKGGSAQWSTLYITDDLKKFYDTDGEQYYENRLAPVNYTNHVQKLREDFVDNFNQLKDINDLENIPGILYLEILTPNLNY